MLQLSFEEAATWASFSTRDKTILQDTVRASIDFLFQKLEKVHGHILLSRALGYLTIGKYHVQLNLDSFGTDNLSKSYARIHRLTRFSVGFFCTRILDVGLLL